MDISAYVTTNKCHKKHSKCNDNVNVIMIPSNNTCCPKKKRVSCVTGPTGERGLEGATGPCCTGPIGERGNIGPTGERGNIGPTGERGDIGPTGSIGPCCTGPTGESGINVIAIDPDILLTPINRVNYWVNDEGLVVQTQGLQSSTVNPVGAFNGGGRGNKSLVEINKLILRDKLVNSFDRLEVIVRKIRPILSAGGLFLYVNMQVQEIPDGSWNGPPAGPDRIVIGVSSITVTDTFTILIFDASDPIWTVAGAPGLNLDTTIQQPLTNVPATATFFYGVTGDGGLPPVTETSPIYFVTGDSSSVANRTIVIQSFTIFFNDGTPSIVVNFI